jgi:penicillin-binding protein 2
MAYQQPIYDPKVVSRRFLRRTIWVSLLVIALLAVLITRLVHLQVREHVRYQTLATHNQIGLVPLPPTRGLIYDRNGVLLADNQPVYNLEIIPERIRHMDEFIAELQNYVTISDDELQTFKRILRQYRPYDSVPLKLNLTEEEVARLSVDLHRWDGVQVKARLNRHYPFGTHFAHILGYVGRIDERELRQLDPVNYRATNFVGKVGIEKFYEDQLHGKVGFEEVETDASGRTVRTLRRQPATAGPDLHLTIDGDLQLAAEKALSELHGAAVAIDPQTGEILALASNPSYDPNLFAKGLSQADYQALLKQKNRPLYHRAIRGQYPLASTIKPFLAIGGLQENIVNTSYEIRDPGWFQLPNTTHVYRDWKKHGHGWVDLHKAIVVSCDTYFYNLAALMGISRIEHTLRQFGFGDVTGLDLAEESPGLVPNPTWKRAVKGESWYRGDTVVAGIGQGYLLTTPLQLANGVATIAARGVRRTPHLIKYWQDAQGNVIQPDIAPQPPVELRDPEIWDTVIKAMRGVITEGGGTGYRFGRNAPYSVAAKTGTAQVYSSYKHSQYDKRKADIPEHLRDHTLFITFAPVDDPQIALAVIVENSKLASNVAREILDYFMGIETDTDEDL